MANNQIVNFAAHYDCQDDQMVIAAHSDVGIGPAVVFDGGAFTDPAALRRFASDLEAFAVWLEEQRDF